MRDPLHSGVHGGGRGAPAEGLRRDRYAACEAAGPLGSLRNLCQYGPAGFFQPAGPSRSARTRSHASTDTAMTCCCGAAAGSAIRAHISAIRASNVQILTGQPITDGIGRARRERPASEV